ncbi:2-succinylbenzoate--CoA ligase [Plectonema radiosum NIES-515]|uniref:2-succinylbenzoate--CoA ligase n=1 Tax=Plectonema radiosum NIES-515 TaxID=2986073 RepID=A0ABT3B2A9_9CYAN|nr:2-succinylbenzoate--CoA ligase [Plectonema radiosum]MCV3215004.1 2-succinylbenzoate--CoA ligase [Plectonema radiosum NIES-515]
MASKSMEILDYIKGQNDYWLIGSDRFHFQQLFEKLYLELLTYKTPQKILLAEREPVRFLAGFIAACAANCRVFLCNPDWGKQEWQEVFNLVQPNLILGDGDSGGWSKIVYVPLRGSEVAHGGDPQDRAGLPLPMPSSQLPIPNTIMIPTGGSSGKIKFAIHTWDTLMASVKGFTEYFQLNQVNSFCVLPLYHVSGLMQFMRSFTTGGKLAIFPFKQVESSPIYHLEPSEFFISLVPTQLQRLLQNPDLTAWLSQFKTVLLGGAPAWNELLEKARFSRIRLAPTYGMTETASQIATVKPDDFLNGKISSGQILPHVQITICNEKGDILKSNQKGNIIIKSQSLALGYYPEIWKNQDYLQVDDLGFLDNDGHLNIVGRSSNKIITGGENVYPIEIESAIRATQMVNDVCVIGIPDKQWGQAITAIYIPKKAEISSLEIQKILKDKLCKFKIPKHWIPVSTLPRNTQGKINQQQLQEIATNVLQMYFKSPPNNNTNSP